MSNNDTTSQIAKWIGITVIGLLLLTGIGIVATTFTDYGFISGYLLALGFIPFHLIFLGVLFFILIIILAYRWLFWSNRSGYSSRYYLDIPTKIVHLKY